MTTGAFPLGGRIMRRRQQLTILALIVLLTSAVLDAQAAPESGHNQISSVPAPNSKDSEAPAVFAISEMQPGTPVSLNLPAVTQATLFDGDYSYSIRVPSGVSQLMVALNWSTPAVDLDLWMRFGQDVDLANGRVVYDYKSTATSTSGKEGEIIIVNSPAPGTYYIAPRFLAVSTSALRPQSRRAWSLQESYLRLPWGTTVPSIRARSKS